MKKINRFLIAAVLMVPLLGTGCMHREVYAWGPGEQTYYVQWENETHRDHVDWERRNKHDQKEYWKWRHQHHDDHDHDHDHDHQ